MCEVSTFYISYRAVTIPWVELEDTPPTAPSVPGISEIGELVEDEEFVRRPPPGPPRRRTSLQLHLPLLVLAAFFEAAAEPVVPAASASLAGASYLGGCSLE